MSATVFTLARESARIRSRTRRFHAVSAALHVALLAWLVLHRQLAPAPERLVEVTWVEQTVEPAAPAVAAAPPPTATNSPPPPPAAERDARRFERAPAPEAVAPRPQDSRAIRDAVRTRLERLPARREPNAALAQAANPTSRIAAAASPGVAKTALGTAPAQLQRRETPAATTALTRQDAPARRPAVVAPVPSASAVSRTSPEPATSDDVERVLDSARLRGEVADRPVVQHAMPAYPEWATRDAVEADVTLRFVVLADGRVKDGIQVIRTAGFLDFDDAATAALRRWRFAPLPAGQSGEQHGSITFFFRLRDRH